MDREDDEEGEGDLEEDGSSPLFPSEYVVGGNAILKIILYYMTERLIYSAAELEGPGDLSKCC